MKTALKKFLEFNGKSVYFLSAKGVWWIAIKPICDALDVDFKRQHKNLQQDKILSQLSSEQTIVAADGKQRKMLCLPEKYVYGWIFQLKSESKALEEYQWKCYELLYNYFHGAATNREELLKQKTLARQEKIDAELRLQDNPDFKLLQDAAERETKAMKGLQKLDVEIVESQLELWHSN